MSMPPWGTSDEPAPQPVPQQPPANWGTAGTTRYAILVEQNLGSGENLRWMVTPDPWILDPGTTLEQGRAIMLELARTFAPKNPWSPQGRQVFAVGEDSYLVLVRGMSRTFHFRVTLAVQVQI